MNYVFEATLETTFGPIEYDIGIRVEYGVNFGEPEILYGDNAQPECHDEVRIIDVVSKDKAGDWTALEIHQDGWVNYMLNTPEMIDALILAAHDEETDRLHGRCNDMRSAVASRKEYSA